MRFALHWFRRFACAADFATWCAHLPPPLSPVLLRDVSPKLPAAVPLTLRSRLEIARIDSLALTRALDHLHLAGDLLAHTLPDARVYVYGHDVSLLLYARRRPAVATLSTMSMIALVGGRPAVGGRRIAATANP